MSSLLIDGQEKCLSLSPFIREKMILPLLDIRYHTHTHPYENPPNSNFGFSYGYVRDNSLSRTIYIYISEGEDDSPSPRERGMSLSLSLAFSSYTALCRRWWGGRGRESYPLSIHVKPEEVGVHKHVYVFVRSPLWEKETHFPSLREKERERQRERAQERARERLPALQESGSRPKNPNKRNA